MKRLAPIFSLALILASLPCFAPETYTAAAVRSDNLRPFSLLSGSPQETTKWERFSPEGEEFAVQLPEQPSTFNYVRPFFSKLKPGRVYSAYYDGTAYIIVSIDDPAHKYSFETIKDEVLTNEQRQILIINDAGRVEKKVDRNGFKGVQYNSKNENLGSVGEFYLANNHVYFFCVYSEDMNQPAVKQFLSSIAIGDKAKAKKVLDIYTTIKQSNAASSGSSDTSENKVFPPKEVTRKALIIARPQPQYTEEARQNAVTGTVVLRAVFSSKGYVTNIKAIKGLPDGLTEKAIAVARSISFIPAVKEGRFVSQYIQIEYNFNLY